MLVHCLFALHSCQYFIYLYTRIPLRRIAFIVCIRPESIE
jgi:hypothetical protein